MKPACLAALLSLTLCAASAAPVTYHYEASSWETWMENSGHNFPTFANPLRSATLDFTLAAPLAANLGTGPQPLNVTSLVQSWSYDGGQAFTTVNNSTAANALSLYLWTDAQGEILRSQFYIAYAPLTVPGLPAGTAATLYVDSGYIDPRYGWGYLQQRVDYPTYVRCQSIYCYSGSEGGSTYRNGAWTTIDSAPPSGNGGTVPEPGSVALVALGLLLAGGARSRRR